MIGFAEFFHAPVVQLAEPRLLKPCELQVQTLSGALEKNMTEKIKLEGWNGQPYEAWVDSDGDIGLLDNKNYSIIINVESAVKLRDWLNQVLPKVNDEC